jgi:ribonuclease M5
MIHLNEAVIVEGKYDKIKLSSIIDAVIIETGGFAIFKDKELLEMIRRLAMAKGVIIMTDSDGAGFKIRSYLRGALPKDRVKNVYMPDILGKEPRKSEPSKEGKLGVEGVPRETIICCLEQAGVLFSETAAPSRRITRLDLYEDGLTGWPNSLALRQKLMAALGLPARLSAGMLLDMLNTMMTYEEYKKQVGKISIK